VALEAMLLKPNMVLPGLACAVTASLDDVAEATLSCLRRAVPAAVAGIAFLSGGQSAESATARLNAMHLRSTSRGPVSGAPPSSLPWPVTFSFGRALQQPALSLWADDDGNCVAAQRSLLHRARCNAAAARGAWRPAMEAEGLSA
jgi:fructose-bisphosphate aldolase class I